MKEPKLYTVHLLRREQLPATLPEDPETLAALPVVRGAFEARFRRSASPDEQRRIHLSADREWLVVAVEDEKPVLTTTDVAAQLGYSDEQIRRMCEAGRFDGDRTQGIPGAYRACVGAQWRIPREAVEWFLEATRPRSRTKPRSP